MLSFWVYIIASVAGFYTGVTNDLVRRIYEHRERLVPGFSSRYNVDRLVTSNLRRSLLAAIARRSRSRAGAGARSSALIGASEPSLAGPERGVVLAQDGGDRAGIFVASLLRMTALKASHADRPFPSSQAAFPVIPSALPRHPSEAGS